jgi:hypothetical protein
MDWNVAGGIIFHAPAVSFAGRGQRPDLKQDVGLSCIRDHGFSALK